MHATCKDLESTFKLSGRFQDIDIQDFARAGGDVSMIVGAEEPNYCIPIAVIDELAQSRAAGPPFFSKNDAKREISFTKLCRQHFSIGYFHRMVINCTPLHERPGFFAGGFPDDASKQRNAEVAIDIATEFHQQMQGYVGFLLTDPRFLQDVDGLRLSWNQLPAEQKPEFPLAYSVLVLDAGNEFQKFMRLLSKFLGQWNLRCLATWDLPCPQGPLIPNYLPKNAAAQPRSEGHSYQPSFIRSTLAGDLMNTVQNQKRQHARRQGLDNAAFDTRHATRYAHMLRVLHLERTIRSRFPMSKPRGLVDAIESSIANELKLSTETVHRYRKRIKQCRRGRHSQISLLNPREK